MGNAKTWGVLIIPAAIKTAAGNYLAERDLGGEANFAHPIIREGDDDEADPIAYAAIMKCDDDTVDVLREVAKLNANAYAYFAQKRTTALQKALHFIRQRGLRIKPLYWMALAVRADLSQGALAFLAGHDITPTQTRPLILADDPDDTPTRAYAAMLTADHFAARVIREKAKETPGAFLFESTDKATSQAAALAFIAERGYKLRP